MARRDPLHAYAVGFVVADLVWLVYETPVPLGRPDAPPYGLAALVV